MLRRARTRLPRNERGQTTIEYAGLLVLIALLFTAFFRLDMPGHIAAWGGSLKDLLDHQSAQVAAGGHGAPGSGPGGGGNGPGGGGNGPGGGGNGPGGGGNGPGGGGNGPGGGGNGPGGGGNGPGGGGNGPGGGGNGPGGGGNGPGNGGNGPGNGGNGPGNGGNGPGNGGNGPGNGGNGPGNGGNGSPNGGNGSGKGGDDSNGICEGGQKLGICITVAGIPNAVEETTQDNARARVSRAQQALINSDAEPGSPEYNRLRNNLRREVNLLKRSRSVTENPLVRGLSPARKLLNPRYKDAQSALQRMNRGLGRTANAAGDTTPGVSPGTTKAANRFLSHLGKFGKGLGVVGTAISGYSNINKDGVGKGLTETIGGAAAAYGAGALATAGCGAVAVLTVGVGGVVCAVGVVAISYGAGVYGSKAAGWAYDHALAPAGRFARDKVAKPVASFTTHAAGTVVDGAKKAWDKLKPGFL